MPNFCVGMRFFICEVKTMDAGGVRSTDPIPRSSLKIRTAYAFGFSE